MKYLLMMTLLSLTLVACSNDEEEKKKEDKPVELKTDKDKWSYYMGHQASNGIMNAQNPNRPQFVQNKKYFVEGFKEGYRELAQDELAAYIENIKQMLGGSSDGSTFDATKASEGCKAIGAYTAYESYMRFEPYGATSIVNVDKFFAGFSDGVHEKANRVSDDVFTSLQSSFNTEAQRLSTEKKANVEAKYKPRWEEVKAIEGIVELEKGIYIETIKEGTGAKPSLGDDVEASYILRRFDGTVKQNSKDASPDGKFQANLKLGQGGLIEGWVIGFQAMRVGGVYRLYVPAASAYGQEPLDFEIEFFRKGPAGTLVKPRI